MKKLTICIMTALLLIIGGCSQKEQQNVLRPMELNEQGKLISQLLQDNQSYPIYLSYDLKDDCKGVKVELWEWKDHQYESIYSQYGQVKEGNGNILVDISVDPVSMKTAMQDDTGTTSLSAYPTEAVKNQDDDKNHSIGRISLGGDTYFQIDEEIPVMIVQSKKVTDGTNTMVMALNEYKNPEKFITKDTEHFYTITVTFQKEAS